MKYLSIALFLVLCCPSCNDESVLTQSRSIPDAPPSFTHVPDNRTLYPNGEASPQNWFCIPEVYQSPPRTTYLAVDEGVAQSDDHTDWIHACQCSQGCQAQLYSFSDYPPGGPIQVHDINFKLNLYGCRDPYLFCPPGTVANVTLRLDYYIEGELEASQTWSHGPEGGDCASGIWTASFSNLSYSRAEINTLQAKLTVGGSSFCENSTTVVVYAIDAACVAGESHSGCHCDPGQE